MFTMLYVIAALFVLAALGHALLVVTYARSPKHLIHERLEVYTRPHRYER